MIYGYWATGNSPVAYLIFCFKHLPLGLYRYLNKILIVY